MYIYFFKKSALFKCKMVVFLLITNQYYLYWLPGRVGLVPLFTLLSAPLVAMARGAWWGSVQMWLEKVESLHDSFSMLASFLTAFRPV